MPPPPPISLALNLSLTPTTLQRLRPLNSSPHDVANVGCFSLPQQNTHCAQVILPDYLTGNPYSSLNQPVWCSYANGARSSILVGSNGHVFYQQGWLNTDALGDAIDAYWEQDGEGTWDDGSVVPGPLSGTKKGGKTAKTGTGSRQNP